MEGAPLFFLGEPNLRDRKHPIENTNVIYTHLIVQNGVRLNPDGLSSVSLLAFLGIPTSIGQIQISEMIPETGKIIPDMRTSLLKLVVCRWGRNSGQMLVTQVGNGGRV